MQQRYDFTIVGGGINGCSLARELSGRGHKVLLLEKNDLGSATSSASTKLLHGGLRYLENYEFSMVRKSLLERDYLVERLPHIAWPMTFTLPFDKKLRSEFMLRAGLGLYNMLAGNVSKIWVSPRSMTPQTDPFIGDNFNLGFDYQDAWVDDSRLVFLCARHAADMGADIKTRSCFVSSKPHNGSWHVCYQTTGQDEVEVYSKFLINASGGWVSDNAEQIERRDFEKNVSWVRGSHLIIKRSLDHAYIFQLADKRIMFALPYEQHFALLGTTDVTHHSALDAVHCSSEEKQYILDGMNLFFAQPIMEDEICHDFAGVRTLMHQKGKNNSTASRDYEFHISDQNGSICLHVIGGKITTFRRLALDAIKQLSQHTKLTKIDGPWIKDETFPGAGYHPSQKNDLRQQIVGRYSFLPLTLVDRMMRQQGMRVFDIFGDASCIEDIGDLMVGDLSLREIDYLQHNEWAFTSEDILYRRTKQYLQATQNAKMSLKKYLGED